jgi:Putative transposase/Transposase zinc-binding domain
MSEVGYIHIRGQTTKFEVADVFREYGDAYRALYPVTEEQAKVMRDIVICRTKVLGGQVFECLNCGAVEFAYHSCRDRHCPKCQKFERAQWVEQQKVLLLPIPYFHLVFTTDHAINGWVPDNRATIYNLLFETASRTLQQFAAQALGGTLGLTAALHTWGQTLHPHVHVHIIVTGGALSFDEQRWVASKPDYLFDIVAMSAAFRNAICDGLEQLVEQGTLVGVAIDEVKTTVAEMRAKAWEVFAKPFSRPEAVYEYLSRYVHAVAISNYRITNIADGQVSFTYYDNQAGGEKKVMTLPAVEFIRRFLWHVLPAGFVRIRHYGLHHSSARKTKLPRARALLGLSPALPVVAKLVLAEWLATIFGEELHRCPFCGALGSMSYHGEVGQMPTLWLWLKSLIGCLFGPWLRALVPAAA